MRGFVLGIDGLPAIAMRCLPQIHRHRQYLADRCDACDGYMSASSVTFQAPRAGHLSGLSAELGCGCWLARSRSGIEVMTKWKILTHICTSILTNAGDDMQRM